MSSLTRAASATVRGADFRILRGSVVDYAGSAIVNAANTGCLGGGGVDGAISRAGGEALSRARKALPIVGPGRARCPTGDSKITVAGKLPCDWVIHSVGPNYHEVGDDVEGDRLLYSAYRSAMLQARAHALPDLAFSLLSAGIFRADRPLEHVLAIGLLAASASVYPGLEAVHFVGFTPKEVGTLEELLDALSSGAEVEDAMVGRLPADLQQIHRQAAVDSGNAEAAADVAVGSQAAAMAATAPWTPAPAAVGAEEAVEQGAGEQETRSAKRARVDTGGE